jgi:hypothetical protein
MMTMSWHMMVEFMLPALRLQTRRVCRRWGQCFVNRECSVANTGLVNRYNRLVCGLCKPGLDSV